MSAPEHAEDPSGAGEPAGMPGAGPEGSTDMTTTTGLVREHGDPGADVTAASRPAGSADAPDPARAARFGTLVEPEIEAMLRVAHRLTGSWADAEDVVQDALVRAYRALDSFDGRHVRAWLFTIVRRTHLNSLRRQRPEPADPTTADGTGVLDRARPAFGRQVSPSAEDLVADRQLDADVEAALAAIDPRFRQVVLLVDVDRLSAADAAEALGVPTGTVVSRLSRGRRRLREALPHRRPETGELS